MTELERRLAALQDDIHWPETPRLELQLDRPRPRRQRLRPLVLGLAVLLALLAGVLALSPGARSALLELFRLRGATVELVETLPRVDVHQPDFGERVGRADAERRVGFELVGLGKPDATFVRGDRIVSFVYGPVEQPRLVLSQLRGAIWDGFVKKVGSRGTTVEHVTVEGEPGLFVSGDEHHVMFLDGESRISEEPTYLAGTVLLWNRGELLLRLEGELTKAEALELAQTVE